MLALLLLLLLLPWLYFRLPKFGSRPAGARLAQLKKSPNYRDGAFQNQSPTPNFSEGVGYPDVMKQVFFSKKIRVVPAAPLPHQKTDLRALHPSENVLVWFGHSSYFMQIDGKKMLVDPVLSGAAAPIRSAMPSFKGTDPYSVDDIPEIDYLFVTHDHWDHLDYSTMLALKPRIGKVIGSLGIGAHFERWGFEASKVIEKDWNETIALDAGFVAHTAPARHFSGRTFIRNRALWTAFVLQTPTLRIFIGGDSGYDTHFAEIGAMYGPFDLVILECGQYNAFWKYIHMMPEEVVLAAQDLRARHLLPVHWGKFPLSSHAWDEPITRVSAAAEKAGLAIWHPMIGEKVDLKNETPVFSKWWEGLE